MSVLTSTTRYILVDYILTELKESFNKLKYIFIFKPTLILASHEAIINQFHSLFTAFKQE